MTVFLVPPDAALSPTYSCPIKSTLSPLTPFPCHTPRLQITFKKMALACFFESAAPVKAIMDLI